MDAPGQLALMCLNMTCCSASKRCSMRCSTLPGSSNPVAATLRSLTCMYALQLWMLVGTRDGCGVHQAHLSGI